MFGGLFLATGSITWYLRVFDWMNVSHLPPVTHASVCQILHWILDRCPQCLKQVMGWQIAPASCLKKWVLGYHVSLISVVSLVMEVSSSVCSLLCDIKDLSLLLTETCCVSMKINPSPPPDNIRVMVIVWKLRGNIIRSALCWIVWHNVHSQQHTHMSSSYRFIRLGLSHWDAYIVCIGGCLDLYYWSMVK